MATVNIDPRVVLGEAEALVDYYRNRGLIQAQAVQDLREENARLKAEIDARTPAPDDNGEEGE